MKIRLKSLPKFIRELIYGWVEGRVDAIDARGVVQFKTRLLKELREELGL